MGGYVGVGTIAPEANFDSHYVLPVGDSNDYFVAGRSQIVMDSNSNFTGSATGSVGRILTSSSQSGTLTYIVGATGEVSHRGSGEVFNAIGLSTQIVNRGSALINKATGLLVNAPQNRSTGTIDTFYGIYIAEPAISVDNFSIYSEGGRNYFGGDVEVAGKITASSICDENGANCKTMSEGWSSSSGSMITKCTNENSDNDGIDDKPECIAAASNSGQGTSSYRALNCIRSSGDAGIASGLINWTGTTWRAYISSYSDCVDGSVLVMKID